MTYLGLRCEACGTPAPVSGELQAVCGACWGPLEPSYDLEAVRAALAREPLSTRPRGLWRLHELLPVSRPAEAPPVVGDTPLLPVPRLAARLGIGTLLVKNEGASQPSLSFKDRLVAVALARAAELDLPVVGCSSTGNLAAALAAGAARAGRRAVILVPQGTPPARLASAAACGAVVVEVAGDYDRANRLAVQVADRYGWGFVNINLRAFYAEGGKSVGFEIAEEAASFPPGHLLVPMAGGGLLVKLEQAFREARAVGLWPLPTPSLHGVQAAGCSPIAQAFASGRELPLPVKPQTSVHSLAVGDPADGPRALAAIRRTGGRADAPDDAAAAAGVALLAQTEGLLVEAAGGLLVAAAGRLAREGAFADGRPVVLVVTGHGATTLSESDADPVAARVGGSLADFETAWSALS